MKWKMSKVQETTQKSLPYPLFILYVSSVLVETDEVILVKT